MISVRCGAHPVGIFLKDVLNNGMTEKSLNLEVEFSDISILDLLKYVFRNSIR